jgi:hypothetical protein
MGALLCVKVGPEPINTLSKIPSAADIGRGTAQPRRWDEAAAGVGWQIGERAAESAEPDHGRRRMGDVGAEVDEDAITAGRYTWNPGASRMTWDWLGVPLVKIVARA